MSDIVKIKCPRCTTNLALDDDYFRELAGRTLVCPACGTRVRIPAAGGQPPPLPAALPPSIAVTHLVPAATLFLLGVLAAMAAGRILYRLHWVAIGRILGIIGTGLVVVSFVYSLRKRRIIKSGSASSLLRFHEWAACLGATLILAHGAEQFTAVLPWLAIVCMLLAVLTGLTGKYLLRKAQDRLRARRRGLEQQGRPPKEIADALLWDALGVDAMKLWRTVHFPVTFTFFLLALLHILVSILFTNWR